MGALEMSKTTPTPPLPVYARRVPHLEMQALLQKFTNPQISSRDLQMLGWLSTQAS
jgi:hypothetical protein